MTENTKNGNAKATGEKTASSVAKRRELALKRIKSETPTTKPKTTRNIPPEERWQMVAKAAYYRAEKRGFIGGNPADDWAEAEAEITAQLGENAPSIAWILKVQTMMQEWRKAQQRMWTGWLDTMERMARSPAKELWEKTVDTWQQSVNNRLVNCNTTRLTRLHVGRILAIALALVLGMSLLLTLPFQWLAPPTTSFMLQGRLKTPSGRLPTIRYEWIPLEQISSNMAVAAVAAEDQKFPNHFGFDLESISRALHEKRKRPRGASTISQQVVKNLYLWPGRSLVRKGLEAYLTVFVEALWPKRRILEVYLNIAEFGPGLYGVGAASSTFFGKAPRALTLHEAALLAAVLPNPRRFSVVNPSAYVRKRASWIEQQARQLGGTAYLEAL